MAHSNPLAASLLVAGGTGAALLGYAHLETVRFVLRRCTVPVLPPGSAPVRVLQISDLHLLPAQHRKIAWVRQLAKLKPDLVIDTGDNWAARDALVALTDALGDLLEVPGVFALGSNDYLAPVLRNPAAYLIHASRNDRETREELPWEQMVALFTAAGWQDADNRRGAITLRDGRQIEFVGTDDAHLDQDKFPSPAAKVISTELSPRVSRAVDDDPASSAPAVAEAGGGVVSTGSTTDSRIAVVELVETTQQTTFDQTGSQRSALPETLLKIGVTHAPYRRVLDAFVADGVDMIFAGHTHGGQICLPGFGALVTNCDLDRHRAKGLHGWPGAAPNTTAGARAGSVWLHVSAGLGTSPFAPIRLACRPEATLLTLVAKE